MPKQWIVVYNTIRLDFYHSWYHFIVSWQRLWCKQQNYSVQVKIDKLLYMSLLYWHPYWSDLNELVLSEHSLNNEKLHALSQPLPSPLHSKSNPNNQDLKAQYVISATGCPDKRCTGSLMTQRSSVESCVVVVIAVSQPPLLMKRWKKSDMTQAKNVDGWSTELKFYL